MSACIHVSAAVCHDFLRPPFILPAVLWALTHFSVSQRPANNTNEMSSLW